MPHRRHDLCVIARVASFPGQPTRFKSDHAYRYVIDTLRYTPGCIACYHLANEDGSLSVSIWEDEDSMATGEAALLAVHDRLAIEGSPPTDVAVYEVAAAT